MDNPLSFRVHTPTSSKKKQVDAVYAHSIKIKNDALEKKNKELQDQLYQYQKKYQLSQDKIHNIHENQNSLRFSESSLQKENKNLLIKLEYLNQEKTAIDKENKQNREYIQKLEFKLSQVITKSDTHGPQLNNRTFQEAQQDKDKIHNLTKQIETLKEQVESLEYQNRVVKNALEIGQSTNSYVQNQQNQALVDFAELKKDLLLAQERDEINLKLIKQQQDELSELIKFKQMSLDKGSNHETEQLVQHINNLNININELTEENIKLTAQVNEGKLKNLTIENYQKQIQIKNEQIKELQSLIQNEKNQIRINSQQDSEIVQKLKLGNQELNYSIDKLKEIIKQLELQIKKQHQEIIELRKVNIDVQDQLEYYLQKSDKNLVSTNPQNNLKSLLKSYDQNTNENCKLKNVLNEALDKCGDLTLREKKLQKQIDQKDCQIENLQNSKSLLQKTLQEQIKILKIDKDGFKDELNEIKKHNKIIKDENQGLKEIVKRLEKKFRDLMNQNE